MKLYEPITGMIVFATLICSLLIFETGRSADGMDKELWYDKYKPEIVLEDNHGNIR